MLTEGNDRWIEAVTLMKNDPDYENFLRLCYYDDPLPAAAERFSVSSEWAALKEFLPENTGLALDVGAGRGISSYALAKTGWEVVSFEPSDSETFGCRAIKKISDRFVQVYSIQPVMGIGEFIPFKDESFDLIYARQALHHGNDLDSFCKEIGRVLKKNGLLIATREHVVSRNDEIKIYLDNHPVNVFLKGRNMPSIHENAYTVNQYVSAIQSGGVKITRILNPCSSDINLFPRTKKELIGKIVKKYKIMPPGCVLDLMIDINGRLNRTPGRLYSFIGIKE